MASRRRNRRGGANGEDILGVAFQQVAQGLLRIQEALRVQEQQAERRAQEAFRLQEQRAATALREAVQRLERERDDAVRALREQLQSRMLRLEDRMAVVEERLCFFSGPEGNDTLEQRSEVVLERRMVRLEAAVERALYDVFPRVGALVAQLENHSRHLSLPSTSSSALGATGGAAADAQEEPLDEEQERRRVEIQIEEVNARRNKALAASNSLGEKLCTRVFEGNLEEVRRLLDLGADVNYTNSDGNCPLISAFCEKDVNREGYRYLLTASPNVDKVVSLLLERGADVNAINHHGASALHFAIHKEMCVALLIDAGAEVDARDMYGATPLLLAALNNYEEVVGILLAAGARKCLRGWGGPRRNKTPFDLARSDAMRDLLR